MADCYLSGPVQKKVGRREFVDRTCLAVKATALTPEFAGTVYYVDPNSAEASDNNPGITPARPFATVAEALTHCQPYHDDVVVVMHNAYWLYADTSRGHALPVQEAVTINVPGMRLIGVSPSSLGVPWTPTANNATCVTVTAMDVQIEGFNFWTSAMTGNVGISAMWDGLTLFGESMTVRNCYFYNLNWAILLDYCWNCFIEGCQFASLGGGGIYNNAVYGDPDYTVIRNNLFQSNDNGITMEDCDYCLIEGNRFIDGGDAIELIGGDYNTICGNTIQGNPAGTNNMIDLTGGASNLVTDNTLSCTIAQYDTTCSDATSGSWGFNHCANGDTTAAPV